METKELEKIKSIIKDYYKSGSLGLYFCSGDSADEKKTLYSNKDGVVVKICYYWEYFEVLGLTNGQAKELFDFYNDLTFEIEV